MTTKIESEMGVNSLHSLVQFAALCLGKTHAVNTPVYVEIDGKPVQAAQIRLETCQGRKRIVIR